MQRIAERCAESGARLSEVLQGVEHTLWQVQLLIQLNGCPLRLVVLVLAGEDGESKLQRLVSQVGLSKAEEQGTLQAADVGLNPQSLARAQEIVGLVIYADKRTRQAAQAASEA